MNHRTPFACFARFARSALAVGLALAFGAALAAKSGSVPSGGGGSGGGGSGATSAADPEVAGELMVKLRTTQALQPLLAKYSLTLMSQFGARPIYRLKTLAGVRVKDVVGALSVETDVMIAEANAQQRSPEARKNVAWVIGTASAYVAQWAPQAMRLPEAQQMSTGAGVRVAVLDTGVDRSHPALAGRLLPGRDFVDGDWDASEGGSPASASYGHGTHVAGLVALAAPGAQIVPVRVLDAEGVGNAWALAEALLWAIDPDGNPATDDGAQVVNISLGSLNRTRIMDSIALIASCGVAISDDPIADRSDPGYRGDETRCRNGPGAVVVAAAGNDGSDTVKEYPAAEGAYGLMAVAATTPAGRIAGFSNDGNWIDLAAPGEGLTSTFPGGGYATWSGTSMAAPLVAGTAALIRAADPGRPAKDVVQRMKRATAALCNGDLVQLDADAAVSDSRNAAPLVCR